jgi:hypothetical protein
MEQLFSTPILFPSPPLILKKKLKQAEDGSQMSQRDLVKMAFKLFNN